MHTSNDCDVFWKWYDLKQEDIQKITRANFYFSLGQILSSKILEKQHYRTLTTEEVDLNLVSEVLRDIDMSRLKEELTLDIESVDSETLNALTNMSYTEEFLFLLKLDVSPFCRARRFKRECEDHLLRIITHICKETTVII